MWSKFLFVIMISMVECSRMTPEELKKEIEKMNNPKPLTMAPITDSSYLEYYNGRRSNSFDSDMFKISSNLEDLTVLLEKLNRTNLDELRRKQLSSESSGSSDSNSKEKSSKSLTLPPPDEISYDRVLSENMKHIVTDQTTHVYSRRRYRRTGFNNYNYDVHNQGPRGIYHNYDYDAPRRRYNFERANYDYRINVDQPAPRRQYERFWGNGYSYNRMDIARNGPREPYNNFRGNNLNYEMNRQPYYRNPGYYQRYPNYGPENRSPGMYRKQAFFNPHYMKNVDNKENERMDMDDEYKYGNEFRPNEHQNEHRYYMNDQNIFVNREFNKRGNRLKSQASYENASSSKIKTSKRGRKRHTNKCRTTRTDKDSIEKDYDVKATSKTKRIGKKSEEKYTTKSKRLIKDSTEKISTKTKHTNKNSGEKIKTRRTGKDSPEKNTQKRLSKVTDDDGPTKTKRLSKTSHEKFLTKIKRISKENTVQDILIQQKAVSKDSYEKITAKIKRVMKEVADKTTTVMKRRILYERRVIPRNFIKPPRRISRGSAKKNIPL